MHSLTQCICHEGVMYILRFEGVLHLYNTVMHNASDAHYIIYKLNV